MNYLKSISNTNELISKEYRDTTSIEQMKKDIEKLNFDNVTNEHIFNLRAILFPRIKTVTKIEFIKGVQTGDLEINDNSHSYYANGIPTHNTVNLPSSATQEDVSNAYLLAHKLHIKGTTVYRDGCRTGVLNKVTDKSNSEITEHELIRLYKQYGDNVITEGINPPKKSYLKRTKINLGKNKKYYFMVGYVTEKMKKPFEFFIVTNNTEKTNVTNDVIDNLINLLKKYNISDMLIDSLKEKMNKQSNVDKISRVISMALRHNIKIIEIVNCLEEFTESISSLIFWIRKHLMSLIENGVESKEICPECGSKMIYVEGCISCTNPECGFSKCG